ncbi:hypothetical protein AGOR_G00228760 [Albula goreensis]|uniref:Mesothelin-like protein n=1 Tax=Albula goreensis TaxID=1534307 RepID=A0A8T3CPL0_9TELE|nr:hypothetical protein AGOR_G00228760 [Albula goreensis]
MTYPRETWKLFVTKASAVLDDGLAKIANESIEPRGPSIRDFLDVTREIRLDQFSDEQLRHVPRINHWFHGNLRPLLSSVSGEFLTCLSSRNLSCETFHHVVKEFTYQFHHLDEDGRHMVFKHLIHPFLTRNHTSDPACINSTNGSADWLHKNFGPYSALVPLRNLLMLNMDFKPLEVLGDLTPMQMADLVLSPHPKSTGREAVIHAVFDRFMETPDEKKLGEFLHKLEMNSRMANFSCETYKTILTRIDHAASSGSSDFQEMSTAIRVAMSQMALKHCSAKAISPGCLNTPVNASASCAEFNSSTLASDLPSLNTTMMLCNGSLMKYACQPSLAHLTAENVAMLLKCKLRGNMTYSKETWKLFFVRVQTVLDEALVMFANMSHDLSNPSLPHVVDVLAEILINGLNSSKLTDVHYISKLFQMKLRPFLPFASRTVLSCLSTTNLSCETFQAIVTAMSHVYKAMDRNQQRLVYTHFIQVFLSQTDSSDPGCVSTSNNSAHWLKMNFGEFAEFLNLKEIMRLNGNFSVMEALPHLTLEQLAEAAATPGQLRTPADVHKLMKHVPDAHLGRFFDMFSPAIMGRDFPMEVRSAMLQQVLDRGNLSDPSVSDMEVREWMQRRLKPLLPHMSKDHVKPFFNILKNRDCNISHEVVGLLDEVRSTLSNDTESEVNANIVQSLKGPDPLRCYMNDSFFLFLKKSFRGFQLPKLSTIVSLMPPPRKAELINSIEPNELSSYLKRPMVVDNDKDLCTVLTHHKKAPELLETERFPNDVARQILPCVLPLALKKMIFVLGNRYDYNGSNIMQSDVYDVIKTYLKTDDGVPKCYNATDPQLNSTAWFLNNINVFINFVTEDDLGSFGSDERLQVFTVDPKNIQLFSSHNIIPDVVSVYTQLIYLQRPNFNPVKLPLRFQCDVPGQAYSQLSENEGLEVFSSLKGNCTDLDPQIEAALAGNIKTISPAVIATLGSGVTGLSTAQLTAAAPTILVNSIQTLGTAPGWSKGQANAIIKVLLQGNFQVGNKDNLINLGSLIGGVPSAKISEIDASVLLETTSNPVFVTNILNAPQSVKQSYVSKIITLGSSPDILVANIPDEMVSEIPRNLLVFPSDSNLALLNNINKKKWRSEQAVLFFDTVANGIEDTETLSTDILQGFTCTRVQTFEEAKVKNLIKACRRRNGRRRVKLRETQLTCMHNFIKGEKPQNFIDFPPEMLLYYNYQDVEQANCKSYFTATGYSNFNVLSAALNGKKAVLLDNARKCLDIKQSTINRENLDVLGNMCCTLEDTYITGSDSYILEKLKNCEDFSETQIKAMEGVLLNDTPKYGPPSKWKRKTLEELGVLPLYFTNNFWGKFKRRDTRKFLRKFLKNLRKLRTEKRKLKRLFKALLGSRFKRSADQCTVGNITQVTISDDAFPFGYDEAQFRHCLSADVVKDNLADLSEKVDDDGFQTVILDKLKEAYPSGLSEEHVTLLGSISRMASVDDISKWNITTVDTLSALMESSDGEWEAAKSKAIITKYLQPAGNTLGSSELNLIGGANLCSLDADVVKTITPNSLRDANTLDVSVCSRELKRELFKIAKDAFENRATIPTATYQLISPYLGGAPLDYIKLLAASNVSMDLSIFQSLDPDVISGLTVDDVKNLLGTNLDDLKTFENATVVQDWIKEQLQSDLDRLGIGLTGGRATPTTQAPAKPTTGQKPTTSGSERASRPSAHQLFVFIGIIFTALQMLK